MIALVWRDTTRTIDALVLHAHYCATRTIDTLHALLIHALLILHALFDTTRTIFNYYTHYFIDEIHF